MITNTKLTAVGQVFIIAGALVAGFRKRREEGISEWITIDSRKLRAWWVQFIIDDVYPGSRYADTAVTKLFLTSEPVR